MCSHEELSFLNDKNVVADIVTSSAEPQIMMVSGAVMVSLFGQSHEAMIG
jgi:hypothetical protein